MKKKRPSLYLLLITWIFVLLGMSIFLILSYQLLTSYYCFDSGKFVSVGKYIRDDGKECSCFNNVISCVAKEDDTNVVDGDAELTSKGLSFTPKFISTTIPSELESLPLKSRFRGIGKSGNTVSIVVDQVQLCKEDKSLPPQLGLYRVEGSTLYLVNTANTLSSVFTTPCLVQIEYVISNLNIDVSSDFGLKYSLGSGGSVSANVCVYDLKIYNQNDKFLSTDKCNVCTCSLGRVRCTQNSCN